jgi:hypothetical protein
MHQLAAECAESHHAITDTQVPYWFANRASGNQGPSSKTSHLMKPFARFVALSAIASVFAGCGGNETSDFEKQVQARLKVELEKIQAASPTNQPPAVNSPAARWPESDRLPWPPFAPPPRRLNTGTPPGSGERALDRSERLVRLGTRRLTSPEPATDSQIDALVYDLSDLTTEEIALVESSAWLPGAWSIRQD